MRRFYEEFYNRKNTAVIDELFSPGYVHHLPDVAEGRLDFPGFRKRELQLVSAFPDLERAVEDQVAEGDRVVTRSTMRGTQRGDLPNIPAEGRKIDVSAIVIFRIADGKIAEGWENSDSLGMMQQLHVAQMVSTLSKARHERGYLYIPRGAYGERFQR